MNRREAVQHISLLLGGSILGAELFLSGCKSKDSFATNFSQKHIELLSEIADTILPPTKTPGAKAAKVGEFMKVMVNDCYGAEDQKIFHDGITTLQDVCKKEYDEDFIDLKPEQKTAFLIILDNEQKALMKTQKKGDPKPYFRMVKELTLLGYFTSEIGCKQALRYTETPGKYDGCVPYIKGDKAWA